MNKLLETLHASLTADDCFNNSCPKAACGLGMILWPRRSRKEIDDQSVNQLVYQLLRPGGSVVSVSDSRPGGCEFETQLRRTFFPAYFCLSPLLKHERKVVGGFGKKVKLVLV